MQGIMTVSDIHGRYSELKNLLGKAKNKLDSYQLVLLGDYIGYGQECIETLELIKILNNEYGAIVLKGNWEEMFLDSAKESNATKVTPLYKLGAKKFLSELWDDKYRLCKTIDLIEGMNSYYIDSNFVFSHSGVDFSLWNSNVNIEEFMRLQTKEALFSNFDFYDSLDATGVSFSIPYYFVAGHVPVQKISKQLSDTKIIAPYLSNNVIGIDFGASSMAGQLGLVFLRPNFGCLLQEIEQREFLSVIN